MMDPAHHDHHHHQTPAGFDRAFAIGIALNVAFVSIEAFYGWRVNSLALLADAGHNLSDVAGLVLAWGATLAGRLPATARRTYGWKRASILVAVVNASLLLAAMAWLTWEAVHRLQAPSLTEGATMIAVAAIGVVVNGVTAALFMTGGKSDLNIRGAFLHMAADALVSLGVVVAGAAYLLTGWTWLDPLTSMMIAAVIVLGSWRLFRQSLHLLFDGVPDNIDPAEVKTWLLTLPGVEDVHDLHVWAMSTSETALTAHLVMPDGAPGDSFLHQIAHELQHRFEIDHPTLQIERNRMQHGGSC